MIIAHLAPGTQPCRKFVMTQRWLYCGDGPIVCIFGQRRKAQQLLEITGPYIFSFCAFRRSLPATGKFGLVLGGSSLRPRECRYRKQPAGVLPDFLDGQTVAASGPSHPSAVRAADRGADLAKVGRAAPGPSKCLTDQATPPNPILWIKGGPPIDPDSTRCQRTPKGHSALRGHFRTVGPFV